MKEGKRNKNPFYMEFGYFTEILYSTAACGNEKSNLWLKDSFDSVLENKSTETTEHCFNLKNN